MELLFVVLGGVVLGLVAQFSLPGQAQRGVGLLPALGGGVAGLSAGLLQLISFHWDGGWIWWISFAAAGIIAFAVGLVLRRTRTRADFELRSGLGLPA
ncbi:hypothetical protein [Mycetocola spongiae]|uniref:hypothetical protein n=1 Tax=Mycetocola spongiae TaxID=2859226 RepID=UPI001CF12969|nr:hypothetical protein [Mycetocola spongiae]UCR89065.1 hypothetical protein KXZ72_14155 [Mycetocola spongiae]